MFVGVVIDCRVNFCFFTATDAHFDTRHHAIPSLGIFFFFFRFPISCFRLMTHGDGDGDGNETKLTGN